MVWKEFQGEQKKLFEMGIVLPMTKPHDDKIIGAISWAFEYFEAMDLANSKIHCASVRYSPITFRLNEALMLLWPNEEDITEEMGRVLQHRGQYKEDAGR
jgi:hypothetical protein